MIITLTCNFYYLTYATLVCVLSDIESAVTLFLFQIRYLGDADTGRREILHDGISILDVASPLLGAVPPSDSKNPNFWFL